jgi:hypothetical protein
MPAVPPNAITLAGGRVVELRPLTLGQWRRFAPAMQAMAEGKFTTQEAVMDALIDVAHASAARSDDTVTRAQVEDALDWHQATNAYAQVLAISMPPSSGEAPVASQPGASTGI